MTTCTPECDAEKAVLVEAVSTLLDDIEKDGCVHWSKYGGAGQRQQGIRTFLADTSPAAAALLAQGERLRELTEAAASVVEGEHLSRELGACEVHNAVDLCWWDKRIANLRAALGEEKE